MTLSAMAGEASGPRQPRWGTVVGRTVGNGCQWCLESALSRWPITVPVGAATWPFLPQGVHESLYVAAGAVVASAVATHRRQSLLKIRRTIRYRSRLRKVKRRWKTAIGRNADMKKVNKASDVVHSPTREEGTVDRPVLLHGWRAWRWGAEGEGLCYFGPEPTPFGLIVRVDGAPIGAVAARFASEAEVIHGSFGAQRCVVRKNRRQASLTDISIIFKHPFDEVIRPADLPVATEPLCVTGGRDEDGEPFEHSLWLPTLIVGRKGSGKSRVVRRLLQGLCDSGQPFIVFVFDPKGRGQEFGWLKNAVWRYENEPGNWPAFVSDLCTAMVEQGNRLGELGLSECPTMDERFPLIVALVDELGTALDETSTEARIKVCGQYTTVEKALKRYLRENRSAGATMVANTQVAQKKELPFRDLFDFVVCLGVNNAETVRMALGVSEAAQYPAHEIPPHRQYSGIGFVCSAERGIIKCRWGFVKDGPESQAIADRIAEWTRFYRDKVAQLRPGQEARSA